MTEEILYVTVRGEYAVDIPLADFASYLNLSEQTTLSLIMNNEMTEVVLPMKLVMEEL